MDSVTSSLTNQDQRFQGLTVLVKYRKEYNDASNTYHANIIPIEQGLIEICFLSSLRGRFAAWTQIYVNLALAHEKVTHYSVTSSKTISTGVSVIIQGNRG